MSGVSWGVDAENDGESMTESEMTQTWRILIFVEEIVLAAEDFCLDFALYAHTFLYLHLLTADPVLCKVAASYPQRTLPILVLTQQLEAPRLLEVE